MRFRLYRHTTSSTRPIQDHCVINTLSHTERQLPLDTHALSVSPLTQSRLSLGIPQSAWLVSAGHACHSKLQADNSWLLFGQLAVVCPFQLAVALLPALCAAAALYRPLRVCALCGLLAHLLLLVLLLLSLHFFVVDGRPQNEGVGPWREGVGVGPLISGGRRRRGVRGRDGGHTKLVEPLDREGGTRQHRETF